MRLLLIPLLVSLVFAAPAMAQGAPPPEVTVQPSQDILPVSRESDATMTVSVTYTSQNPIDPFNGRSVQLTASQLPAGWSVAIDPHIVPGALPDEPTVFNVRVTLGASAEQSAQDVTFTAQVARAGFPAGNPLADIVDPEATATTVVTLQREDPLTREVLENVGGWIWAVLGGIAILAVVLAVVLARSNRPVVALSTPIRQAQVAPGRSVAVPIVVENLTGVEDNVVFHVAPVREGWAAALPVPELPLDGRRREELHLVVTAPRDAQPGQTIQVGLTAHGAQNPKRPAEIVIEVAVGDTPARKAAGDTTPADVQQEPAKKP